MIAIQQYIHNRDWYVEWWKTTSRPLVGGLEDPTQLGA